MVNLVVYLISLNFLFSFCIIPFVRTIYRPGRFKLETTHVLSIYEDESQSDYYRISLYWKRASHFTTGPLPHGVLWTLLYRFIQSITHQYLLLQSITNHGCSRVQIIITNELLKPQGEVRLYCRRLSAGLTNINSTLAVVVGDRLTVCRLLSNCLCRRLFNVT